MTTTRTRNITPFTAPEFYDHGVAATVQDADGSLRYVYRTGDAPLAHEDGRALVTADEFRTTFPDGNLPEDGEDGWTWTGSTGRFALDEDEDGETYFDLNELCQAEDVTLYVHGAVPTRKFRLIRGEAVNYKVSFYTTKERRDAAGRKFADLDGQTVTGDVWDISGPQDDVNGGWSCDTFFDPKN